MIVVSSEVNSSFQGIHMVIHVHVLSSIPGMLYNRIKHSYGFFILLNKVGCLVHFCYHL